MSGGDKDRFQAGLFPCRDIAAVVADQERAGEVEVKVFGRFVDHPGARFAATACLLVGVGAVLRVVRAVINGVEVSAAVQDLAVDGLVDRLQHIFAEKAAGDARLVGDDDHFEAGGVQFFDRRDRTRDKMDLLGGADVAAVFNDRPVAVEEDRLAFFSHDLRIIA